MAPWTLLLPLLQLLLPELPSSRLHSLFFSLGAGRQVPGSPGLWDPGGLFRQGSLRSSRSSKWLVQGDGAVKPMCVRGGGGCNAGEKGRCGEAHVVEGCKAGKYPGDTTWHGWAQSMGNTGERGGAPSTRTCASVACTGAALPYATGYIRVKSSLSPFSNSNCTRSSLPPFAVQVMPVEYISVRNQEAVSSLSGPLCWHIR